MNTGIDKILKLFYCDKKSSNTAHCSKVACYSSLAVSEGTGKEFILNRCEEHKLTATVNKRVKSTMVFNQSEELAKINIFLKSLIGKEIFSTYHRNKYPFIGKYIKDNGSIMCQDGKGKWALIYYHQIKK